MSRQSRGKEGWAGLGSKPGRACGRARGWQQDQCLEGKSRGGCNQIKLARSLDALLKGVLPSCGVGCHSLVWGLLQLSKDASVLTAHA